MSKVLAIDFGLKRCGLAISDASQTFAFALKTIDSKALMQEIERLCVQEKLTEIVIGKPKRLNLEDSHITQNVNQLKAALEAKFPTLQLSLYDERFTSKLASQAILSAGLSKKKRSDKTLIDQVSATIILQDYLQQKERK
jgi:putative Holliday junction resolvase